MSAPIAMNTQSTGSTARVAIGCGGERDRLAPLVSLTAVFPAKAFLGFVNAFSCLAVEARRASRWCARVTLSDDRVRKVALSSAELSRRRP